jgi:hypothetical protein
VEAMFPGYLFAKFVYAKQHRAVESSHGIRGIVHFGDRLATLPENIVVALQSRVGAEEVVTVGSSPKIGQPVNIVEGPFEGLEVVVTQVLPAKERIRVLLDFSWAIARDGNPNSKSAPRLAEPAKKRKVAVQRNGHFASSPQLREDRDALLVNSSG